MPVRSYSTRESCAATLPRTTLKDLRPIKVEYSSTAGSVATNSLKVGHPVPPQQNVATNECPKDIEKKFLAGQFPKETKKIARER